jgi:hypothetical protein
MKKAARVDQTDDIRVQFDRESPRRTTLFETASHNLKFLAERRESAPELAGFAVDKRALKHESSRGSVALNNGATIINRHVNISEARMPDFVAIGLLAQLLPGDGIRNDRIVAGASRRRRSRRKMAGLKRGYVERSSDGLYNDVNHVRPDREPPVRDAIRE